MSQLVLVVLEPWHHKPAGRVVAKGDIITDPSEIDTILDTRPHHVVKRMSHPHEDDAIAAKLAAEHSAPAPAHESE